MEWRLLLLSQSLHLQTLHDSGLGRIYRLGDTQFGLLQVLASIGQLEFFYDQAPDVMRSCSMALQLLSVAAGSYLSGHPSSCCAYCACCVCSACCQLFTLSGMHAAAHDLCYLATVSNAASAMSFSKSSCALLCISCWVSAYVGGACFCLLYFSSAMLMCVSCWVFAYAGATYFCHVGFSSAALSQHLRAASTELCSVVFAGALQVRWCWL